MCVSQEKYQVVTKLLWITVGIAIGPSVLDDIAFEVLMTFIVKVPIY